MQSPPRALVRVIGLSSNAHYPNSDTKCEENGASQQREMMESTLRIAGDGTKVYEVDSIGISWRIVQEQ